MVDDSCDNCGNSRAVTPGGYLVMEPITKMMMCKPCFFAFVLGYSMGRRDWLTEDKELRDRST
jgi:hypothetical protein